MKFAVAALAVLSCAMAFVPKFTARFEDHLDMTTIQGDPSTPDRLSFHTVTDRKWGHAEVSRYVNLVPTRSHNDKSALELILDNSAVFKVAQPGMLQTDVSHFFAPNEVPKYFTGVHFSFQPRSGFDCNPGRTYQILFNQDANGGAYGHSFDVELTSKGGSSLILRFYTNSNGRRTQVGGDLPVTVGEWHDVLVTVFTQGGGRNGEVAFYHAQNWGNMSKVGDAHANNDISLREVHWGLFTYNPDDQDLDCPVVMNIADIGITQLGLDAGDLDRWMASKRMKA